MNATNKVLIGLLIGLIIGGVIGYKLYQSDEKKDMKDNTATVTENLPTYKYVDVLDWPPKLQTLNAGYACVQAGEESSRAGKTEEIKINGRTYCRTKVSEGAAGSVYTEYAYLFAIPSADASSSPRIAALTFSTRKVQCANYEEPQRSACMREQADFNIEPLVDNIARLVR